MRKLLKIRWFLLAVWVIVTVLFTINQPNLKQILNQKGQASISENSPSKLAADMINKMGSTKGDTAIFVFNDQNKISEEGLKDIQKGIENLGSQKSALMINSIMDPFNVPEAKSQLVSKDGTTLIVQVAYEKGTRDSETIIDGFKNTVKDVKVTHYITGELAINNDYLAATNKGVEKSAIITVIFILFVLILMFRSVVTPFVSLFAVGIAYLCSMGIMGILINVFNFPITSLTQMFMILVLFGIGTDYNILLFNRFKEELGHGLSIDEAIVTTYKTAGKTVFFSGLTVFMAFASLSFVQFPIYRSANAVAIGIAVLLLELLTLTPVLMKLIAGKLFWPSHHAAGHKESKIWESVTGVSVKHPALSLLVVAAIITPVILFNSTKLSFDSLKDLSADNPSVQGFNLVADKFGRGKAMPTTIVLENKDALDNNEALAVIDSLTEKLKNLKGIDQVSSATQPTGAQIESFYTSSQTKTVVAGLTSENDGLNQINTALKQIDTTLPNDGDIAALKATLSKLSTSLDTISTGMGSSNAFLTQISSVKGFYIPKQAFGTPDIEKMFSTYMSKDRKITKLTINLSSDPYSHESIDIMDEIRAMVSNELKGTKLSGASFGLAGPTSSTYDLNKIATHDIAFTQVIVLICIFILLVFVIRSFWIPVYIVGSLLVAYYAAISVTALLTTKLFSGMDGMSWNVPFFSFVVIAALGVDYSIFLMTRFKEYPDSDPKEAIILAAKNIGGVVTSAALILAGTFATLYPSNIHVLMELAICVVTGLFLLSVILLPIVIPALISVADKISKVKAAKDLTL